MRLPTTKEAVIATSVYTAAELAEVGMLLSGDNPGFGMDQAFFMNPLVVLAVAGTAIYALARAAIGKKDPDAEIGEEILPSENFSAPAVEQHA